ncbi:hypothetical protein RRG08_050936 [Elysia crispata]|uniref:Uncharacterized protein n=1 Tax=Elysia crispata TaxID=231223 RepID=A0AAE1D2L8_9GAST|nr:hypothetical protein RRG08_050936 [Elysia crispata]
MDAHLALYRAEPPKRVGWMTPLQSEPADGVYSSGAGCSRRHSVSIVLSELILGLRSSQNRQTVCIVLVLVVADVTASLSSYRN